MMKSIVFFLLASLLVAVQTVMAQGLPVDGVTALSIDRQGCCYAVRGSSVAKYDAQLAPLARYASEYGKITSIDASDPLKILLFCKDFLRLQLLDSKLSALGKTLFLPDVNALQPAAACASSSNGAWIADGYRSRLLYLDFTLNTTREVCSLDSDAPVSYMVERGGVLYLNFSGSGLLAFDRFGAVLHRYSVPAPAWFDVQGARLYYLHNGTLYEQNIYAWSTPPRPVATGVEHCAVGESECVIFANGRLEKIAL
jgi:hypothetical protein